MKKAGRILALLMVLIFAGQFIQTVEALTVEEQQAVLDSTIKRNAMGGYLRTSINDPIAVVLPPPGITIPMVQTIRDPSTGDIYRYHYTISTPEGGGATGCATECSTSGNNGNCHNTNGGPWSSCDGEAQCPDGEFYPLGGNCMFVYNYMVCNSVDENGQCNNWLICDQCQCGVVLPPFFCENKQGAGWPPNPPLPPGGGGMCGSAANPVPCEHLSECVEGAGPPNGCETSGPGSGMNPCPLCGW